MPRVWAHQLHGNKSFQHCGIERHSDRFGFEALPYQVPICKFSYCPELFPGSETRTWGPGFGVAWVLSLSPPCSLVLSSRMPLGHRPCSPRPQISSALSFLAWMSVVPFTPDLGIRLSLLSAVLSLCLPSTTAWNRIGSWPVMAFAAFH